MTMDSNEAGPRPRRHSVWRPPTLRDVAARAEVSLATASRVLSGQQHVDPTLTHRVVSAASDLGYRLPRPEQSQDCVAVLTAAIDRIGYSETLTGILEAARDEGLLVEIHVADASGPDLSDRLLNRVLAQPIVGVIVLDFDSVATALTGVLPQEIPVAIAGGVADTVSPRRAHCYIDDFTAAQQVTRELLDLGHRTVGYLGVPQAGHPEPRLLGWQSALDSAGITPPTPLGIGWSASRGRHVAEAIARERTLSAVLCGNDELAIGLIAGLADAGIQVPDEVSVVGFDDHPLAAHCRPALTTVKQDFAELGRRATRELIALADKGIARHIGLPTRVIHRQSVAPPPHGHLSDITPVGPNATHPTN